ncbi:MAG: hypothetical protein JF599_01285 [Verrucomicrobia bacterium]|nr:hypothetical protein [Verrucomicrobiota bacterium]
MQTPPQTKPCATIGATNERAFNGAKWHELLSDLLELHSSLRLADEQSASGWAPDLSHAEAWDDAWDVWRHHESRFLGQIHATAKEWVRTHRLPDLPAEIVYYLGLRYRAAINLVESSFLSTAEQGPSSLISFPPVPTTDVAEWLLTEWGDAHAIYLAFPEVTQS